LFVLLTTVAVVLFSLIVWPLRFAFQQIRRRRLARPMIGRLIIVGFDGQDPKLTERYMTEGRLPHFRDLASRGSYHRLKTTFPAVSPVAWSSFSTGTNPARHNVFDFIDRDRRTYRPVLSSARIGRVTRQLRIGRFRLPLARPELSLLRRSRPFWSVLGEHGIWSTILRVPITFPPERFHGAQLSAMATPDLRGTQGTFTVFTTRALDHQTNEESGQWIRVHLDNDRFASELAGPEHPFVDGGESLVVRVRVRLDRGDKRAYVELDGTSVTLERGSLSDWVTVGFRAAPGVRISGICRLLLTEMEEHVSLYVSPINIDPERPAMPISHPGFYATYLAKRIGKFATLGMAEDTSALNAGVIEADHFLRQAYDIDAERQSMFFAALDRLRIGTLVTVFDATDRVQHMFWRQLEDDSSPSNGSRAIEKLYEHNDALVGRILERLRPHDVLMVLSDHGFARFRRGININAWLRGQGYLVLKPGTDGTGEWLSDVDWTRTRAYALGLAGMFLNLAGREGKGIVNPGGEADTLKAEIIGGLGGLVDPGTGEIGITEVFDTRRLYSGPYLDNAPDLLVGYNTGFRASWDSATGISAGPIFQDNTRAWSGDHCIDPRLVPGILFSSRRLDEPDPALIDIAPTALRLFGVSPPAYMEGKVLFRGTSI
jgi:predicted AlkP superfamily phosphohydrolase/phosphomutase